VSDEGGFDLNNLLEQAQAMQEQVAAAQEAQANQVVTGSAGGGKVNVVATGGGEFRDITIAPDVVDPDDIEMLEELVLAAVRDAAGQIADLQASTYGDIEIPDLGGLGGMLGNQ
jgi:DNA-binding YbaB/EbfC family protein